ncbi:MAG: hypothetical protein F4Y63_07960 [Chloroflexi bacterium]|nr:hypothetical protein [Chloroflexota bacterium]MYF79579.1 hypothetical protein [Chloroflexota bacterium]
MTSRIATRLTQIVAAASILLLALHTSLVAGTVFAQQPPPELDLALVNSGREFVERMKNGEFVARPVFSGPLDELFYAIRDGETGEWLTSMYRIEGGEKRLAHGWEYSFEYPALDEHPELDAERVYLLVMLALPIGADEPDDFYAVIPVHQPTGLWDRVLAALDPGRWARALAGWIVQGTHGTLCAIVQSAGGATTRCRCGAGL